MQLKSFSMDRLHSVHVLPFFSLKSDTILIYWFRSNYNWFQHKKMNTLCTRRVLTKASEVSNSPKNWSVPLTNRGQDPITNTCYTEFTGQWALLLPVCIFDRLFLKKIKSPMIQNVFIFPNFQLKIQKKKFAKNIHFCYSRFSSEMCVIFV